MTSTRPDLPFFIAPLIVLLPGLASAGDSALDGSGFESSAVDNSIVLGDPALGDPPGTLRPRTVLLAFDPILEGEGGQRLHAYAGWNDPLPLTDDYRSDLESSSHGWLVHRMDERIRIDAFPIKVDGFRYTDESYVQALGSGGWHMPDGVDYKAIVRDYDLARRVDRGEIDEVVVHGAPYFGYYESRMAGLGGYWCNSPPLSRVACSKIFVMMGLNYERGVAEEIHSYGHRAESILTRTYGSWDITQSRHDWERFTHNIGQSPDAACGSVHYPPNGTSDYNYANPTPVSSTAVDWELNFPDLTGQTSMVDRETWGGPDYQRNYLNWWYAHMPHVAGSNAHDGLTRWNSWWPYLADFNRWPESGGDQPRAGPPPPALPLGQQVVSVPTPSGYGDDWSPRVTASETVYWRHFDGNDYEIWFFAGDYGWAITDNEFDDEGVEVNDQEQIVWQSFDGQDYEIFSASFSDDPVQITNNSTDDRHPALNGDGRIVWEGWDGQDYEIFSANHDGSGQVQITNNSSVSGYPREDVWPKINDSGRVAWFGYDGNDWEVFSANSDGTDLVNVSNNTLEDEYPEINTLGTVVWHTWHAGQNAEVYSANATGGAVVRLSDNGTADWYPQINSDGRVAWMSRDSAGDWEIRAADADGTDATLITDNATHDQHPGIDDTGRIVWQGLDGEDWEIYLWEEGTVYQVTDNEFDDRAPSARGGELVWHADDGPAPLHDSGIYILSPTAGHVESEPGAGVPRIQLDLPRPNPSRGAVEVHYYVPARTEVDLVVLDVSGREVESLWSGTKDRGWHSLEWNGSTRSGVSIPSGQFFLRLSSAAGTKTERMLRIQ